MTATGSASAAAMREKLRQNSLRASPGDRRVVEQETMQTKVRFAACRTCWTDPWEVAFASTYASRPRPA